ncbi:MAG: regulatory protein RecX [Bryobacteraceae bacterium]
MAARGKPKILDSGGLWDYALRVLGQRAHSANELKQKLSKRSESAAEVAAVMGKLRDYGLADDTKFSEAFASSRLQNRGFGRFRVLRDLRSKRVSGNVAEAAVEKTFAGTDETELIQRFLERKYRGKKLEEFLKEEKNVASVYRRLRVAGFSSGNSLSILKRYAQQVEQWTGLEDDG